MESSIKSAGRRFASALIGAALASCAAVAAAEPGYLTTGRGDHVKTLAGLCVHTGEWKPGMTNAECDPVAPVAEAPAPAAPVEEVKAEPAPAPEPAPIPVVVTIEKISLSSEVLFAFDSATLREEGKRELDALAQRIAGASLEGIAAIGYADRIGSSKYNKGLSEKRAEEVKRYLAFKGVDASLLRAEGRGESEPVTGGQCKGLGAERAGNKKLVECLQPDRRVEIEVLGTRTATAAQSASGGETR